MIERAVLFLFGSVVMCVAVFWPHAEIKTTKPEPLEVLVKRIRAASSNLREMKEYDNAVVDFIASGLVTTDDGTFYETSFGSYAVRLFFKANPGRDINPEKHYRVVGRVFNIRANSVTIDPTSITVADAE